MQSLVLTSNVIWVCSEWNPWKIKFTMELEWKGCLFVYLFWMYWFTGGTIGSWAGRFIGSQFTINYILNKSSPHDPAPKRAVLSTEVHRAKTLSDPLHLREEIEMLRTTFFQNGYSWQWGHPRQGFTVSPCIWILLYRTDRTHGVTKMQGAPPLHAFGICACRSSDLAIRFYSVSNKVLFKSSSLWERFVREFVEPFKVYVYKYI